MAGAQSIDPAVAAGYFAEAKAASEADGGALWGMPLYGPMLLVHPQTREIVANQADAEGKLSNKDKVWVGTLPADQTMANTAKIWAGVEWTMILWPALGGDKVPRTRLMMHELFHRIQDDLGLPAANPANAHLDTRDGRVWMQLEWRALAAALKSESEQRKSAIEDALIFRQFRRSLVATAFEENALEINEGLAEYTGVRLSGQTEPKQRSYAAQRCLNHAQMFPNLTRSFAYTSGPAYGLLLDAYEPNWRKSLKADSDLAALLLAAAGAKLPPDIMSEAVKRAASFDGKVLMESEDRREAQRQKNVKEYQAKFVEGPKLTIPLGPSMNYSYDPNTVQVFEGLGMVYPTLSVTDQWGVLEVTGGAVMIREGDKPVHVIVSATPGMTVDTRESKDWKLDLKPGWRIVPRKREGDFHIEPVSAQSNR
jgi:hypothetical protein